MPHSWWRRQLENVDLPKIFADLDAAAPEGCILATTSSISITRIAAATGRPEKVIGMHFMNPVPVIASSKSSAATPQATRLAPKSWH